MTGQEFARLLSTTSVQSTSIDITFNKIKSKAVRKISYEQFVNGLKELGKTEEGFVKLCGSILSTATRSNSTLSKVLKLYADHQTPIKTSASDITARLTDPSRFTGTQKVNFEARESRESLTSMKNGVSRESLTVPQPSY